MHFHVLVSVLSSKFQIFSSSCQDTFSNNTGQSDFIVLEGKERTLLHLLLNIHLAELESIFC